MSDQEGISQDQTVDPGIDAKLATGNLWQRLQNIDQCSRLLALVRSADLTYVLERSALQTLFAPTDDALKEIAIKGENAEEFLLKHLARGGIMSYDLRASGKVNTVAGQSLPVKVSGREIQVGSSVLLIPDVPCTNGVLHVVNRSFAT
jgi:uncharacterized surface protein with fasciclin (FAS1) repeats